MILKVAIKCYCEKNKGGIIYEKSFVFLRMIKTLLKNTDSLLSKES